jgi:RNA polymerase sigma factor (TIGR02999 family)
MDPLWLGNSMSEVTEHLVRAREGDADALERVYELLYPELKRLAVARLASLPQGATLTPTVLVNEAYLRLRIGDGLAPVDRRHLMACAARAMRFILVDHVRAHHAAKRGSGQASAPLTDEMAAEAGPDVDLLAVDRALLALGTVNEKLRDLVELRFFGGLGEEEIAELHGVSARTVRRDWRRARAFLHAQIVGS